MTDSLIECPKCGGIADNGHDRCLPPNPYYCTKCQKAYCMPDGSSIFGEDSPHNIGEHLEKVCASEISDVDSIAEAVSFGLINAEPFTTEEVIRVALARLNGTLPIERKTEPVSGCPITPESLKLHQELFDMGVEFAKSGGDKSSPTEQPDEQSVLSALDDVQIIRNVAGDIDIGYFQNSEGIVKKRGNVGGIVSRTCDRLESKIPALLEREISQGKAIENCPLCKRETEVSYFKSWQAHMDCKGCGFHDIHGILGEPILTKPIDVEVETDKAKQGVE